MVRFKKIYFPYAQISHEKGYLYIYGISEKEANITRGWIEMYKDVSIEIEDNQIVISAKEKIRRGEVQWHWNTNNWDDDDLFKEGMMKVSALDKNIDESQYKDHITILPNYSGLFWKDKTEHPYIPCNLIVDTILKYSDTNFISNNYLIEYKGKQLKQ